MVLETYFQPDAPDEGWTRMGRGMMQTFTPRRRDESAGKVEAQPSSHFKKVSTASVVRSGC